MKILILGDIFGEAGKSIILENLPFIKKQLAVDLVIANAENVSNNGKGLSYKDYKDLNDFGVDYFTMGNHTFKQSDIYDYINEEQNIIRPANFGSHLPGRGSLIIPYKEKKILLMNLLGKELMSSNKIESPFLAADQILDENEYDVAILDFHAETTSEKKALAYYLKNRVDVFYGTHTHIQTADETITHYGQAYITDIGMVGISDSAIGVEYEEVIQRLLGGSFSSFKEKKDGIRNLNGILVTLYDNSFKPFKIERINMTI